MKQAFILCVLLISVMTCMAQSDTLKYGIDARLLKVEKEQADIQLRMEKAHNQFKTGTLLVITGLTTSILGTLLFEKQSTDNSTDLNNNQQNPYLILIGAGVMTAGVVIQIDSHKYFSKRRRFTKK